MQEFVFAWYSLLGGVNASVAVPLRELAAEINLPFVSALLFGLIGATSPCQLTTSASAAVFLGRDAPGGTAALSSRTVAFVAGKVAVYLLLGLLAISAGQQLSQASVPVAILARRILGPLMIVMGLHLLHMLPVTTVAGAGLAGRLESRAGKGSAGAFVLGFAFAWAFCPTLFLLFFGLTVPLILSSPGGLFLPAIFALGTVLPLLVVVAVLRTGLGSISGFLSRTRWLSGQVSRVAGVVFLLAGLNDTLVYWFL